jgi:ribosomal protein RSM22 (predicted rRNA methylase)
MKRIFSVPAELETKINTALQKHFGLTLQDSKKLAESVKSLSDYFIENPQGATPWKEAWAQIAYLAYFLPLNHARVQAVVSEARQQSFFEGLSEVVDFGAGFGTASLALVPDFAKFTLVEKAKDICAKFDFLGTPATWLNQINILPNPASTLTVFSYSLTELEEIPAWAKKSEALMILEPATQQDGRKLLELRQKLIADGYSLWAPCTHQGRCPLLTLSKTDWCHDRIFFGLPSWFEAIEQHLPMKNRTLTTSYLLARRKPAPLRSAGAARTVGDRLKEKGKDRQMVCRGEEREFLAWMHKHGLEQEIPRGVRITLPETLQKVSNELRVSELIQIL